MTTFVYEFILFFIVFKQITITHFSVAIHVNIMPKQKSNFKTSRKFNYNYTKKYLKNQLLDVETSVS